MADSKNWSNVPSADYGYGYPNAQKKFDQDAERKVFVGGISMETTEPDLHAHFSQFGDVKNIQIKYDPTTGRSRGFAFVEFQSPDSCRTALKTRVQEIKGKRCEVKRATSITNKKVFVGGISPDISDEELRAHFIKYGEVDDIEFPVDKTTQRRRNFCFIIFTEERGAQAAVEQRKHMIGDRYCDVKLFEAAPPKQADGGAGAYGYGYDPSYAAAAGFLTAGGDPSATASAYGAAYANGQYPPEYAAYWQQYWQYYYGQYYAQAAQAYEQQSGQQGQQQTGAQNSYGN